MPRLKLSTLAAGFNLSGGDPDIEAVTEDSRRSGPGTLFVAIVGTTEDGHGYVDDAIARGAAAVATETPVQVPAGVAQVRLPDSRKALALLAARFYGHPAAELGLIGFTGTFGKTSTSDILRTLIETAGQRTGVLGSLGARYGSFHDPGRGLTTPAPVELHRALRGLRDAGADHVIMEVTSHALRTRRVDGVSFAGGLLAAIRPGEHTDFHRTYDDYVDAKRLFLDHLSRDAVLAYDADNRAARDLAQSRTTGRAVGFSLEGRQADLVFDGITLDGSGARFVIDGPLAGGRRACHSALLGSGHLRNVALALTYALSHGVDVERASECLATLRPLRRRMECFEARDRIVLDDTAGHPDSLRAALSVAASLPHTRMVVVYAVRGNRGIDINHRNADALADLAAEYGSTALIVTAASEATAPVDRVSAAELTAAEHSLRARGRAFITHDRLDRAIAAALELTGPGDLIVLLGAQGMNEGRRMVA